MPLYEYECLKCRRRWEEQRRVDDRYDAQCKECKTDEIRLVLYPPPKHISWSKWNAI